MENQTLSSGTLKIIEEANALLEDIDPAMYHRIQAALSDEVLEQSIKPHAFTIKETGIILNCARSTLWKLRKKGVLVPISIGGIMRYRVEDIEKILGKKLDINERGHKNGQ